MERDPVCGMTVDPLRAAAQVEHAGKNYFFCGKGCAEKFRLDPEAMLARDRERLAAKAAVAPSNSQERSERPLVQIGLATQKSASPTTYTCPMDPEIRQDHPGACPKCGMALEAEVPLVSASRLEYTCPMHPEIVRPGPGSCPICGMALEPRTVTAAEPENPELALMSRRFWVCAALTVPILILGMADMLPGMPLSHALSSRAVQWIEFVLATPVVLWGAWPFFERGWRSIVTRNLNMFTLIAIGTGAAYLFSVAAALAPQLFPPAFRGADGRCRSISKRPQRSRLSSCSANTWSFAREAKLPTRFAHCSACLQRARDLCAATAPNSTSRSSTCKSATVSAFAPVRKFQSTAWSSTAKVRSMNR